jgi:hypothetical protein
MELPERVEPQQFRSQEELEKHVNEGLLSSEEITFGSYEDDVDWYDLDSFTT